MGRRFPDPDVTPYAAELLARIDVAYRDHGDPARASAMTSYLRGQFPFLGLGTPTRRALDRLAMAGLAKPTEADLASVASGCWQMPEREFQHFGVDHLRRRPVVGYCERRAAHPDFFVRKAIAWALREYSKTDGQEVMAFVGAHQATLAPLSRREALKWLERRRTD